MYRHAYHRSLVYKMWLCGKPGRVENTFEDALAHIKQIHALTLGVPQICYLVGWQFEGHDSKYPAWSQANAHLKRTEDTQPIDSLLWLMREARHYNATVSLHINMCDAYQNSPLWDDYAKADLLVREVDRSLKKGGVWGGEQSYLICKAKEWASGYARQRIDALLEMLPLADSGTVHIDVFQPMPSPYHGISRDDDMAAIKSIIEYWQSRGVDVTKEWWHHELVGLVPMVYHSNFDEASRLKYPADVACGGGSAWNMRQPESDNRAGGFSRMPEPGCLYEEAWGESIDNDLMHDIDDFAQQFYLKTVPFIFLNQFRPVAHSQTAGDYEVQFNEQVRTHIRKADRHLTLHHQDRLLIDGHNILMPASWCEGQPYIAYSRTGGEMRWRVPPEWPMANQAETAQLYGGGSNVPVTISAGFLRFTLTPKTAIVIRPVGG